MEVDITTVKEHIENNGLLIDVRDFDECNETGLIPTAEVIPLSQIEESFLLSEEEFEEEYDFSKPTKAESIILYCVSGARSNAAASILTKMGYKASNYTGSFAEWKQLGNGTEFYE